MTKIHRPSDVPPVPACCDERLDWMAAVRQAVAVDAERTVVDLIADGRSEAFAAEHVVGGVEAFTEALLAEAREAVAVGRWAT